MLKRATSEGNVEEDYLNARLLTVQMWLVYWIVNGSVSVAESLLLLKHLPLYSLFRFLFSAWLIAPIVMASIRVRKAAHLLPLEIHNEWVSFSKRGCGLVYFGHLKPLFENQLRPLFDFNFERLLNSAASFSGLGPVFSLVAPRLLNLLVLQSLFAGSKEAPQGQGQGQSGYAQTLNNLLKSYWSREGKSKEDLSEYDVIDTPPDGSQELKQRSDEKRQLWWGQ